MDSVENDILLYSPGLALVERDDSAFNILKDDRFVWNFSHSAEYQIFQLGEDFMPLPQAYYYIEGVCRKARPNSPLKALDSSIAYMERKYGKVDIVIHMDKYDERIYRLCAYLSRARLHELPQDRYEADSYCFKRWSKYIKRIIAVDRVAQAFKLCGRK